jgi:hypothetical protein
MFERRAEIFTFASSLADDKLLFRKVANIDQIQFAECFKRYTVEELFVEY